MFSRHQNTMISEKIESFKLNGGIDQMADVDPGWASSWNLFTHLSHLFEWLTIRERKTIYIVRKIIQSVVGKGYFITDNQCLKIGKSYGII
jgi:hypothetical protein